MKSVKITAVVLFSINLLVSACAKNKGEWQPLFNGQDLSGWHIENSMPADITVKSGEIVFSRESFAPTWLRSEHEYENFELEFDYLLNEWCTLSVFLRAPRYGDQTWGGYNLRLNANQGGTDEMSTGAVFPVIPALAKAGNGHGVWNHCRILMQSLHLKAWVNGTLVQNCDLAADDELKFRLKQGYIGFQALAHAAKVKNMRLRESPATYHWIPLFNGKDFSGWREIGSAQWEIANNGILRSMNGDGYLLTHETFQDFEFRSYVRCKRGVNGGIFFRWINIENNDRGYEIQIEDLQDSKDPTGSLYNIIRANRPRVRSEEWFLMQVMMDSSRCVVRVNGETLVDYDNLTEIRAGHVGLQMHRRNSWIEYRDMRMRKLNGKGY
ncbi:DUF1080 domain-containing protein [candidate division KSB1 bacterium]|nr:DUF1080 domain-containing protein [candidate division KSB1 bacterium]